MFLKKFLNQPNLVGSMLIVLMVCSGFVYAFAFDGINVETATGGEVEAWLAAAGGGSSGGSGGGGSDDMPPESPTPENPEGEEEEEGGTEDTPPEEPAPEDPEDDGEGGGDDGEGDDKWDNIDFTDTGNWPNPPSGGAYGQPTGTFTEGDASLKEYRDLGEKSLYDSDGGEWRPHPRDSGHDPHWDYKPYVWSKGQNRNVGGWRNIDLSGEDIPKN